MNKKPIHRIDKSSSNAVLDAIGGNSVASQVCSVSSQAVSHWRRHGIPEPRFAQILLVFRKSPAVRSVIEGMAASK